MRKGWIFVLVCLGVVAGGVMGQTLGIRTAIELQVPTEAGAVHQLEVSRDLVRWRVVESGLLGTGQPLKRSRSVSVDGPEYFRVVTDRPVDLGSMLEGIRTTRKVPALAAVVMRSNRVVAMGVTGVRRTGTDIPVTLADKWHQGSLTKSMTATLAAILVQEGRLSWESTVGSVLGELVPQMNESWRTVTLGQLLRHRGGAPDQAYLSSRGYWSAMWNQTGSPEQQRVYWLRSVTTNAPQVTPGTAYVYSNAGYVFAGMMLEKVMGRPWEELMRERLFAPLGMDSAGFGVPATPRYLDQPWGHQWSGGNPNAIFPGNDADNPAGLGPAGTVHCSLLDMGKYGAFHALEGRRQVDPLVTEESFRRLHIPLEGETYAYGWGEANRAWAGGRVISHAGSNVQWYSNLWVAPIKEGAIVVLTNIGDNVGSVARQTTDDVVVQLLKYME